MRECEDRSHHLERASRPNPGAKWSQAQPWMRWGCRGWSGCRSSTTSASWACFDISGYFWVFLGHFGYFWCITPSPPGHVWIFLGTFGYFWQFWGITSSWSCTWCRDKARDSTRRSPRSVWLAPLKGAWWVRKSGVWGRALMIGKISFFWKTWESTRQKMGWTN